MENELNLNSGHNKLCINNFICHKVFSVQNKYDLYFIKHILKCFTPNSHK